MVLGFIKAADTFTPEREYLRVKFSVRLEADDRSERSGLLRLGGCLCVQFGDVLAPRQVSVTTDAKSLNSVRVPNDPGRNILVGVFMHRIDGVRLESRLGGLNSFVFSEDCPYGGV
jgi:hypothetical protein